MRRILMCCFLITGYVLNRQEILLPWTLSTVPYAAFLIMVGAEMAACKKFVERKRGFWDIPLLAVITLSISLLWHLNLCTNQIYPAVPLTIGAVAGTLMMFRLSVWISSWNNAVPGGLQVVGRETFIVVAFSQGIIVTLNHFLTINPLLKYAILIAALVVIKYLKDCVNKFTGTKIL